MYSLTAVTRLTGLNASTLRTWERRYGVPQPTRSEANRRTYSADEVMRLRLIATLVAEGHAISELARLPAETLQSMADQVSTPTPEVNPILARVTALIAERRFAEIRPPLAEALALLEPDAALGQVFIPLMRHIGLEWASGRLPVYGEHLVSALVRQLVLTSGGLHQRPTRGPRMLFTTLSGDRHELGSLFAWYLATCAGADAVYLGPDLPVDQIAEAVAALGAEIAVVSLTVGQHAESGIAETLRELQQAILPSRLWLGVRAGAVAVPDDVLILSSVAEFWQAVQDRLAAPGS